MPIYEYTCQDCGQRFEIVRQFKDADAPTPCSACLGEHTSRNLSLFFASSGGKVIAGGNGGCGSCAGGSCASCGH